MPQQKIFIGFVMVCEPDTANPYTASRDGKAITGDRRVSALRDFRDGKPIPFKVFADRRNEHLGTVVVTDPRDIDWTHMRD